MKLTALVLAKDETAILTECLAGVRFCDEIVVVFDASGSAETRAIADQSADLVILRHFDNFADQRNAGLDRASGDWIFAIDADEFVSVELVADVRDAIAQEVYAGFRLRRRSEILGRVFRGSGTQADRPLRLFRRDRGRWVGEVHEEVQLNGPCGELGSPLLHRTDPDVGSILAKIELYANLEAQRRFRQGRRFRPARWLARPVWEFAKRFALKGGFLDGWEGLMFCGLAAVSAAVEEWKLRALASHVNRDADAETDSADHDDSSLDAARSGGG